MTILLIKADQLHLFEKLVPVKAAIRKDGTVQAAHTAIRHVKRPEAPKAKPATHHVPEVQDLFDRPAKAPAKPKPPAELPLFDRAPESVSRTYDSKENAGETKGEQSAPPAKDYHEERAAERVKAKREAKAPPAHVELETAAAIEPAEAILPADGAPLHDAPIPGLDYSAGLPADLPEFGVAPGTTKGDRRALNERAAAMVNGRSSLFGAAAEPIDLDVLRQYSGWGGCGDSLNEFYTDNRVAAAMWAVLHRLGVGEGANVLEPSCGTGVFMAMAPAGVKVTGVELDGTSSKVAAQLHPNHEVINSSLEAFATTDARQFDAVIGNPPFGDSRGSFLKDDKPDIKRPEQYFTDTALDKAKPGGLVALVLPTGVMDSRTGRKVRERLIRKGEFLGALRMPNTAFEASHTGVTTDVVFFRKRPEDVAGALSVVDQDTLKLLGAWDEEFVAGNYFTSDRGSGNVLGTMTEGWRAKAGMGDDITVEGSMVGVAETIAEFEPEDGSTGPSSVHQVLEAVADEDMKARIRGAAARRPYDEAKRGDTRVVDGVTYVLEGEPLRWHRVDEFMAGQAVTEAAALGTKIERAVQGEAVEGLADEVRAYIERHGIPSKNPNLTMAARQDKAIYRLIGAVKKDGSLSDVVQGRRAQATEGSFDVAAQTLALEVGYFTPSMVAGRWTGGTEETVLDHLYASPDYAMDPLSGTWTSVDQYLSGELWPKYDEAKAGLEVADLKPEDRAKLERQVKLLEETIDPKSLEDVEIQMNSGFVPLDVLAAFLNRDKRPGEAMVQVAYDEGYFSVTGGWGDPHLVRKYLNRDGVQKDKDLPRIEVLNRKFKEWLCASEHRDRVEEEYNRKFRGFRQRAYSETPFEVPGLNNEGLKSYQWSGLRWALEAGKGIIAADVGLGKTARALILNKLMKSTGQARRPMIIVPKSVAANWMREAEKWFPGSSVMVIGETYTKDKKTGELKGRADTAAERNQKFHDIRQNDYDFILITQPAWNDLDLDPDTKQRYQDDDFWEKRKKSMGKEPSAKQLAKMKDAHDAKLAGQEFQRRTDALYFNDLGVDALISDEMHAYKNLFAARDRFGKSPKFLGGSSNSKRAADMRYKTAWLRDQTGGRNVYGLTATPTKNSPLEVYSMLSHIAPEAFERIGIRNSEDFLDRFCVFEEKNILDTSGRMTRDLCVTGFKNLGELREIMRRYIDRKTAEDVGLQLPERDDQQHLVDISAAQKEVYAHLRTLAEEAKNKGDASGEGHPFSIMHKMDRATLDLELYDPKKYAGARSPKIEECVSKVKAGLNDGGQIVFCDAIEAHDKIVRLMVEAGIPRDQIGVLNAKVAPTSAKRQNVAEAYRAGKLRVVIGNATMEEGVDGLQADTTDIHHLNIPWTASAIQQRNGRAVRQGNKAESIRLHTYLGKGTFDGYRYQTVAAKKDWQDLLWNGGDKVENLAFEGGMSRDEMLIALSENPDEARKQLEENKALAQAKLDAEQHAAAADAFKAYRAMRASYQKLAPAARAKVSGERLAHKLRMAKASLEANPYFKAKHALDADHEVVIAPGSGDAIEPGAGLEIPPEAKIPAGRYVVDKVIPQSSFGEPIVHMRQWGSTAARGFALSDLSSAKVVEHDKAAEEAHIAEKTVADLGALKGYKDLRELPSAVIEKHRDRIQAHVNQGLLDYRFGGDAHYGGFIGTVTKDGKPWASPRYDTKNIVGTTHDAMLPIEEHRQLAFQGYAEDEAAKKYQSVPVKGRRGSYTGTYESKLRYPGGYDQDKNRWAGVIKDLWGEAAVADAHRKFESQQLEQARRAPDLKSAIAHALPTSVKRVGADYMPPSKSQWSRKALATLWAKAKRGGHLRETFMDHLETKEVRQGYGYAATAEKQPVAGADSFSDGREYGSVVKMPVGSALMKLALANHHHDLAAAMAVDYGATPEESMAVLRNLPDHQAKRDAIAHLTAKHPHLKPEAEEPTRAA